MEVTKGSIMKIHCYKHNGKIHRTWDEVIVLDETNEYVVCANNRVKITEADGRTHKTRETAIVFLYKNNWFHVTAQLKNSGLYYKVDIASPFLVDDNIIKYIDYDLDIKVFPDGDYKILDKNEYKFHKKIMKYPENLDTILLNQMDKAIKLKDKKQGPFDTNVVNKYYKMYLVFKEKTA